MKKIAVLLLLALLAPLLFTACAPAPLILYTDLDEGVAAKMVAPFTEKTGIPVEIVAFATTDRLMAALAPRQGREGSPTPAPTENGKPADVILTKSMLALPELAARDVLESHMPATVADLPGGANGGGYWYGFGGHGWVLAWNTGLAQKQPDGFQDLASDAYPMRSVSIMNIEGYYYYPLAVYAVMGQDYAMSIFQTLLLNETHMASSAAEAAGLIANGTCHVGITTYAEAKERKDGGAAIDFIFPDQDDHCIGAYVEFLSAGIAKGGKNLKAAKQLEEWLLSPEAEKLSVELGLSDVTLRDVGAAVPVVKPLNVDPMEVMEAGQGAQAAFEQVARGLN